MPRKRWSADIKIASFETVAYVDRDGVTRNYTTKIRDTRGRLWQQTHDTPACSLDGEWEFVEPPDPELAG